MPAKPLLLFLITDLHLGGAPRFLADLAIGLHTISDFELLVVSIAPLPAAPADTSVPARMRNAGIEVLSLNAGSSHDFRVLPRFIQVLRARKPRIVSSILIHANLLATLARPFAPTTRLIHAIHTLQTRPAWHWYAQGLIAPFADAFVAPTQAIVDRVSHYGMVQSPTVIPNGIDVDRFTNAPHLPPQLSPVPPGTPLIGYVGRFDPVKNLGKVIAAYSLYVMELQQVNADVPHLVLVGWGAEEKRLKQQASALGLTNLIHFPGPTNNPEMWLKSFDCTILASEVEGFPLAVVESLAAGTPVVAVESPAIHAIVGNSYPLCKSSDVDSLLHGLREVMLGGKMWITRHCPPESICSVKNMAQLYNNFFKNF